MRALIRKSLIVASTLLLLSPFGQLFSDTGGKNPTSKKFYPKNNKTEIQIATEKKQEEYFNKNKHIEYIIPGGATLSSISAAFGIPYREVFEFNKENNPYFHDIFPTEDPNLMMAEGILYIPLEEGRETVPKGRLNNLENRVGELTESIEELNESAKIIGLELRQRNFLINPEIKMLDSRMSKIEEVLKKDHHNKKIQLHLGVSVNPSSEIEKDVYLMIGYHLDKLSSINFKNGTGPTNRTEFSYIAKTPNLLGEISKNEGLKNVNLRLDLNVGAHKIYFDKGINVNKIHNAYGSISLGLETSLPFNTFFRFTRDVGSYKDLFFKEKNQGKWSAPKEIYRSLTFKTGILPLPLSFSYENALLNNARKYDVVVSLKPLIKEFGKFEPQIGYSRIEQELKGKDLISNRIFFGLKPDY